MPAVALAIGSIVIGLINFFGKWLTKRIAVVAAAVVAIVAATAAFVGIIEGLVAGISYSAPDFSSVFLLLPDNYSACIGAMITGKIAHWVYGWNTAIIQMKLF